MRWGRYDRPLQVISRRSEIEGVVVTARCDEGICVGRSVDEGDAMKKVQ